MGWSGLGSGKFQRSSAARLDSVAILGDPDVMGAQFGQRVVQLRARPQPLVVVGKPVMCVEQRPLVLQTVIQLRQGLKERRERRDSGEQDLQKSTVSYCAMQGKEDPRERL